MLKCDHIPKKQYRPQRWQNGLGETQEIAVDTESPFRWRISLGSVTVSAPFSEFPGYRRQIVLLSGGPIALSHKGQPPRTLRSLEVYSFSGDLPTTCELAAKSEVRDFNLFCLGKSARGNIYPTTFKAGEEIHFPLRGNEHFIFAAQGGLKIAERNTLKEWELAEHDTFRLSRPSNEEYLDVKAVAEGPSTILWVVIHLN